ncbi:MAG: type II toxin-antitoxin system HicB family antitoxin [Bacteroidetes bacterium]|nr:type II toxin-antitoxin system HicB family antitoxin [Bacteroidota bacterium]
MKLSLTAAFKKVKQGYIAWIEEIPGVNTQGATKKEATENLEEALQMILEANRELSRKSEKGQTLSRKKYELAA